MDVMKQQAIVVAMVGANTKKETKDPVAILNSVCNEGWELLSGSFVFVEVGQFMLIGSYDKPPVTERAYALMLPRLPSSHA